jgi:hypothetical protein
MATADVSGEEIAGALALLGEDATVERIEVLKRFTDPIALGDRPRVQAILDAVEIARARVDSHWATAGALTALSGPNCGLTYGEAGVTFGRDGRFTTVQRGGHVVAYMQGVFSKETLLTTLRENLLPVREGHPYPPRLTQAAVDTETHYSEQILDELVRECGWSRSSLGKASVSKVFRSEPDNKGRVDECRYEGMFDEPRCRYLSFRAGDEELFDVDARDRGISGVATEFDARACAWARDMLNAGRLPRISRPKAGQDTPSLEM